VIVTPHTPNSTAHDATNDACTMPPTMQSRSTKERQRNERHTTPKTTSPRQPQRRVLAPLRSSISGAARAAENDITTTTTATLACPTALLNQRCCTGRRERHHHDMNYNALPATLRFSSSGAARAAEYDITTTTTAT